MPEILDIIDSQGNVQEQLEAARNNFLTLTKQTLKLGAYLLASVSVKVAQSVASTAYVALQQFSGSFTSSGGLVQFTGSIVIDNSNAGATYTTVVGLFIDDVEKAQFILTGFLIGSVPISYSENLNAGNHKWQLKALTATNTAALGYYASGTAIAGSNVFITEFIRG